MRALWHFIYAHPLALAVLPALAIPLTYYHG